MQYFIHCLWKFKESRAHPIGPDGTYCFPRTGFQQGGPNLGDFSRIHLRDQDSSVTGMDLSLKDRPALTKFMEADQNQYTNFLLYNEKYNCSEN